MFQKLFDQSRSIVLSYFRAVLVLFVAGLSGGLTGVSGRVLYSLGVAAAWGAVPAGLRAIQAFVDSLNTSNVWLSAVLSFVRAGVATGLMTLVGPISTAAPALHAFVAALGVALVRVAQELLDRTAPPPPVEG